MSEKIIRKVRHVDWIHLQMTVTGKTIAESALAASQRFADPGPWIVSDDQCSHEILCEKVTGWRCVNLRGSAEGV